ncbi:MAG: RsmD family RNA methyltransferase [Tepidisphaeraceae bacterium]
MRIIAGEFRGRRLLAPEEAGTTRPVTDRVKQSLFDILTPSLDGAAVYDCFAGTGSMGLEALSRGARHVTFFEADRSAGARLRRNIQTLGVAKRSHIITGDLFRWFRSSFPLAGVNESAVGCASAHQIRGVLKHTLRGSVGSATTAHGETGNFHPSPPAPLSQGERGEGARRVDLVFLDPPYRFLCEKTEDLRELATHLTRHLAPAATVVFRHDAADALALPNLLVTDLRTYGSMTLEFLHPTPNTPTQPE